MSKELDRTKNTADILTKTDEEKIWYAPIGMSVVCPVPDCGHMGSFISKIHCRNNHGMERHELGEKYGEPKIVRVEPQWGW